MAVPWSGAATGMTSIITKTARATIQKGRIQEIGVCCVSHADSMVVDSVPIVACLLRCIIEPEFTSCERNRCVFE